MVILDEIVITGLGVISAVGAGKSDLWKAVSNGKTGIATIHQFDASLYRNNIAGEVKRIAHPFAIKYSEFSRATQFAIFSCMDAMKDAELDLEKINRKRIGISLGTNFGDLELWLNLKKEEENKAVEKRNQYRESPFTTAINQISRIFSINGPKSVSSTACAAGLASIGYAMDLLRCGNADVMLAGGYDALSVFNYSGLNAIRAISSSNICPFDKERKGTILGEGSAVLVMETLRHANARRAKIYARILGYGINNNGYHLTAPDPKGIGITDVMNMALKDAAVSPKAIDHIFAHGTGTKYNDKIETQAIKEVFGVHAYHLTISGLKPIIGHTMGAAGSIESAAAIMALNDNVVPPTINYKTPDSECDLDYVPNQKRMKKLDTVLCNAYGFGGNNTAVIFSKY